MKFIRTEHNIFEVASENEKVYFVFSKEKPKHIYPKSKCQTEVIKQAETIEELCDEFVVIRDNEYILVSYSDMKDWFDSSREKYGAIWTDKGLIYVAKMNEKGELELL